MHVDKAQLRWRCRRGMRELDQLLERYLENTFDAADPEEKSAFAQLVELSDPQLIGYFLRGETPEPHFKNLIEQILSPPKC